MREIILRSPVTPEDSAWDFRVPELDSFTKKSKAKGKIILFNGDQLKLELTHFPQNRILYTDEPSAFVLASFDGLRFKNVPISVAIDYVNRFFKAGFFLNGVQYRFYHHSNSQLRSRSCFLRRADTDQELDTRINKLGEFTKIMNTAKRAKRIGLLFSSAEIDYRLDPKYTRDITDIRTATTLFSDGCGLISKRLAMQLSKKKQIMFRCKRYVPCVYQIRYLGYKGVVMLHPKLDDEKEYLVEFRDSMKKLNTSTDPFFSVVGSSAPYSFGRLNNDIIVLLASLGISTEALLKKQQEYFDWIKMASSDVDKAIDFLSCLGEYGLAERVLLDGLDNPEVKKKVNSFQTKEVAGFKKKEKVRVRMMIHKSRLLYGVCDPFRVLKEGEVHVRVTVGRAGATTLTQTEVLVVRNPCLHPGDCLKLKTVSHPLLSHLVDCVVFASVGKRAAPEMSSGGDLDGDKFFVCWDPDIVPVKIAESYTYPPNKEVINTNISRADLANHFASYNSMGLARVVSLHQKWARVMPNGAMSVECQELNALHSQSVDGARVKIPDRLRNPPESKEPYVIDVLTEAATEFSKDFLPSDIQIGPSLTWRDAEDLMIRLLRSEQTALDEYEIFNLARSLARKYGLDLSRHIFHLNPAALTVHQKYEISSELEFCTPEIGLNLWNSLFRSDILNVSDLMEKGLDVPIRLQRLYSSNIQGLPAFFEYLKQGTQDFKRKLLIFKTGDRFAYGIFIRGDVPWDEDAPVNRQLNIAVCSFMRHSSEPTMSYSSCSTRYRLHCSDNILQLYDWQIANTFVFINRPPIYHSADIATSVALQKISGRIQRQVGRIQKAPVIAIEIHVVSNRDRLAHQFFDLRFERNFTEEKLRRFDYPPSSYELFNLKDVDWTSKSAHFKKIFTQDEDAAKVALQRLSTISGNPRAALKEVMLFATQYHVEDRLFWAFDCVLENHLDIEFVVDWLERRPTLVFALLRKYPPGDSQRPAELAGTTVAVARSVIRSANMFGIAALVALEKIQDELAALSFEDYVSLLKLTSLCVRARDTAAGEWLAQEVILVLHESRQKLWQESHAMEYFHRQVLAVAFDRLEEAATQCPCDPRGNLLKQRNAPIKTTLIPFVKESEGRKTIERPKNGSQPLQPPPPPPPPPQPKEGEHITKVKASARLDASNSLRLHSHVRLQSASTPEKGEAERVVVDATVVSSSKGELVLEVLHPLPPEFMKMQWNMYDAGGVAMANTMFEAIMRLEREKDESCGLYDIITMKTGANEEDDPLETLADPMELKNSSLNESQITAVQTCRFPLSLIWGPPGTGKTTVVVEILTQFLRNREPDSKVLVTASTHNAVDNVLERFISVCHDVKLLEDDEILRVATDHSKVGKSLQAYTIDARVGGDINQNDKLKKEAERRVKRSVIVFTTCAGAGLGTLRSFDFETVLIDEASQITEPCALIPLVKGCKRAVLVGDHVQLRPTVQPMGKAISFDVSLLERVYNGASHPSMRRAMLDIQYRFPERLARFPSKEFYKGKLRTGLTNSKAILEVLLKTSFPWPKEDDEVVPTIFVQCSTEEDFGGASKSNSGQAKVAKHIISMLTAPRDAGDDKDKDASAPKLSITILSPYSKQVRELSHILPSSIKCYTIDSFQGRESDIIILSTVRCNDARDIGFVDDERRLNVAWTRAKLGLIIIGDRSTLAFASPLWKRALDSCVEVMVDVPDLEET